MKKQNGILLMFVILVNIAIMDSIGAGIIEFKYAIILVVFDLLAFGIFLMVEEKKSAASRPRNGQAHKGQQLKCIHKNYTPNKAVCQVFYEKVKREHTENEVVRVEELYAFEYALNGIISDRMTKEDFIHKFAVPLMVEILKLEEFAFNYVINEILIKENVKNEFIEWFYSGNWIKVEEESETD